MNAFECYQTYLALKQHFTNKDYDYHKYRGKVNASVDSFRNRKDRFFFEKIAKHPDVSGFLLSNIVTNPNSYVRDLAYNEQSKKTYVDWLKKKESISYHFTEQLKTLDNDLKTTLVPFSAQHPKIIREYLGGRVSLETLCIICDITKCVSYWEKQQLNDTIFDDVVLLVKKYIPFITYNKKSLTKIVRDKISTY